MRLAVGSRGVFAAEGRNGPPLAGRATPVTSEVRRLSQNALGYDPALWKDIAGLGWPGLITAEALHEALRYQESVNIPLGALALSRGLMTEKQVLHVHTEQRRNAGFANS